MQAVRPGIWRLAAMGGAGDQPLPPFSVCHARSIACRRQTDSRCADVWDDAALVPEALRLSDFLDDPVYDCLYLALAMDVRALVVIADRRFAAAAARDP